MKRTAVVLGALAILTAIGTGAAAAPAPGPDQPIRQHERTGAGVLALDWGDLDDTPNAGAGDFLVMEPWEYDRIPALRADNPHLRILMYKDASAVVKRAHETVLDLVCRLLLEYTEFYVNQEEHLRTTRGPPTGQGGQTLGH